MEENYSLKDEDFNDIYKFIERAKKEVEGIEEEEEKDEKEEKDEEDKKMDIDDNNKEK